MNFVYLKQFLGIRNDFGSFGKRTLGCRLENRLNLQYSASVIDLKIQVTAIDTFHSGSALLLCFDLACVAGRIVNARKAWQSEATKPRGMVCKILYKVLRKCRGLSKTFLSPYAVAVILATGGTSNQFTSIPKGNVFYIHSVSYIIITCICRGD